MPLGFLIALAVPPPPWTPGAGTEQIIAEGVALAGSQPARAALDAARFCYSLTVVEPNQYNMLLLARQEASHGWARQDSESKRRSTITLTKGEAAVRITHDGSENFRTCSFDVPRSDAITLNLVQRVVAAAYLENAMIFRATPTKWSLGNGETVDFYEAHSDSAQVITVTHSPTQSVSAKDH